MSATKTKVIELYAVVDNNGYYGFGLESDDAITNYEENIGELKEVDGFRMVKVLVTVPLPEVVTLSGTVGQDAEALLAVI